VVNFLPSLLEKLNDPKEKLATPSRTSISLLGKKCFEAEAGQAKDGSIKGKEKETLVGMWERQVKEGALGGKGWRGKVEGMKLILGLKAEVGNKMTLKPWLGTLVELLEDGDSNVRETAREVSPSRVRPRRSANWPDHSELAVSSLDASRGKSRSQEIATSSQYPCIDSR
jgi:CLIP-associating protein 1/2